MLGTKSNAMIDDEKHGFPHRDAQVKSSSKTTPVRSMQGVESVVMPGNAWRPLLGLHRDSVRDIRWAQLKSGFQV